MGTRYTGRPDWHIGGDSMFNTPTYCARVDEICGTTGAAKPTQLANVSMAWNPRMVLRAIFGGNTEAAYSACQGWALGQESLKDAVSAACEWAVRYHGTEMRRGQSVCVKPGNFVRASLSHALPQAARSEGLDLWKRDSGGNRSWVHAYRVELARPAVDEEGNASETTELDDPALRPPQEADDDAYHQGRRKTERLMLDAFVEQWSQTDPLGAEAFRAVHLHQRKLSEVAEDFGVSKSTVKRRADKPYAEAVRQFERGRQMWHRENVPKPRRPGDTGSGSSGAVWYEAAWPPSVLAGVLAA